MVINQGDVFWANLRKPVGSEPGYRHPVVIIQNNVFNASNIMTVVTCALTSNLKLGHCPGNVRLLKGESGINKACVVNVTQIITLDKRCLAEKIGTLNKKKTKEVIEGVKLVTKPKDL